MTQEHTDRHEAVPASMAAPPRGLESFRAELTAIRMLTGRRYPAGHRGVLADELQSFGIALAVKAADLRAAAVETDQRRLSPRSARMVAQAGRWCAEIPSGSWPADAAADIFRPWELAFFESEVAGEARKLEERQRLEIFKLERDTLDPLTRQMRSLATLVREYTRRLRKAVQDEAGAYSGQEALAVIDWIADPWEGVAWDADEYIGTGTDERTARGPDFAPQGAELVAA